MPIRSMPCNTEPLSDMLVERNQLCVKPFILEANCVKALLPPEHQSFQPAKVVLVHGQAEALLNGNPSLESFPLSLLLASLQAGRAGKSTLEPSLSIPSHRRSTRHAV